MRRRGVIGVLLDDRSSGLLFMAIGGVLVCAALAIATQRLWFLAHARSADAIVTGDVVGHSRHGPTHCPVLTYEPEGIGHRIEAPSPSCTTGAPPAVGAHLRVLYDPARIDEPQPIGFPIFAVLVGLFLPLGIICFASGLAFFRRRSDITDVPSRRR